MDCSGLSMFLFKGEKVCFAYDLSQKNDIFMRAHMDSIITVRFWGS